MKRSKTQGSLPNHVGFDQNLDLRFLNNFDKIPFDLVRKRSKTQGSLPNHVGFDQILDCTWPERSPTD